MAGVITITASKPFSQKIRIPNGKNTWANLEDFEVRAQLRQGKTTDTPLIYNLHDDMTKTFVDNDIVIEWKMDGQKTRAFYALTTWKSPKSKKGFVNIVLSDDGTTDSRALVCPTLTIKAEDITTKAEGST